MRRRSQFARDGFTLLEEATHLLRSTSAATLATYYLGSIPFVLGFLYFWADMARNPLAGQHVAEAALAVAALFVWMKFCQARFGARLRSHLGSRPMPRWSFKQSLQVAVQQSLIHASGLFIIPVALVIAPAFGWVYRFYQNVTVLADPDTAETSGLMRKAWLQSTIWWWQYHVALGIAILFGLFVFIDLLAVAMWTPNLIKMFLGIESDFSRSPFSLLNSTFFAAVFWTTYLLVDPLLKSLHVVKCFYGESLKSGEDLKAGLKEFSTPARHLAAVILISLSLVFAGNGAVQAQQARSPQIAPAELDQKIEEVIRQARYAWRMPRSQTQAPKGLLTRFVESVNRFLSRTLQTVSRWIDRLFQAIFGNRTAKTAGSGFGWGATSLPYFLLILMLGALAVLLFRLYRKRDAEIPVVAAEAIQGTPDIRDENVGADHLPEDGWTKLARELLSRGEFRLAMRAFYLSSLAHLAQRNLIGIARYKSNRDYERELWRRGHAIPELVSVFGSNLSVFERIWYGTHHVDLELVQQFMANVDRIRSSA